MRLPRGSSRLVRPLVGLAAAAALTVALSTSHTSAAFTAQTGDGGNQVQSAPTFCTAPSSIRLPVSVDTAVYEAQPWTTYGTSTRIGAASGVSADGYSLLRFSLGSAPLPVHCRVTSATLWIHASTPTGGVTLHAHRADRAWDAATLTWNTVGRPEPAGTAVPTASLAATGWQQWDVTTLTRELYAGPDHGFLVKDAQDNAPVDRIQYWDSSESTTPENRPYLDITWG